MLCLVQLYLKKIAQCFTKIKLKYVCACVLAVIVLDLFGAFTHIFEVTYTDDFIYPYHGNVQPFVDALKHKRKPDVEPINEYNYSYIHNPVDKCVDPDFRTLRLVFLVKSTLTHFAQREGIRNSWGFGKRFFDVPTRLLFLLGVRPDDEQLAKEVSAEAQKHKDILQGDFIDSYYNNTIKIIMGFKWAVEHCTNAKFYMFVDDDIYVSVKNVLRFVRNPAYYPDYLKEPSRMAARKKRGIDDTDTEPQNISLSQDISKRKEKKVSFDKMISAVSTANISSEGQTKTLDNQTHTLNAIARGRRQVFDFELPDDIRLFAGYVFVSSPHRHRTSKWYISLKEYPYHLWPPYVTAGAFIVSKQALIDLYYTSLYTQFFKFDDIFLGIVAKKADIEPFHCDEFHFYKKDYTKYNYKYVITSHGYENPRELVSVWHEQKSLGNA